MSPEPKTIEQEDTFASGSPLEPSRSSSDSTVISVPATPPVIDHDAHTLRKRPWRIRSTPFKQIVEHQYHGEGTEASPFVLEWLSHDYENPQTYGKVYKWVVIMVNAVATLAVALASSAYSGAVNDIAKTFAVTNELLIILGVSLFVLGFALGPLIWAPASEVYGRRNTYILTYTMFTVWNAAAAGANSMTSLLIFRFLAGAFGSSPLVNAGGTVADVLNANERGLGMAIFAAAPFLGPAIGPITGGFLGDAAGFRWVEGYLAIFSGVLTIVGALVIPETYAPTLLRQRAALLCEATGKVYRAPTDVKGLLSVKQLLKTSLTRPWVMLFTEPVVAAISIYMAIIYGTLYMLFAAFPIVFQQGHGWNAGVGGLAFLGVLVGMLCSVFYYIFYENPRYVRVADASPGGRAPAESRLPPGIGGGVLIVIGLAWFAATCGPSIHWIVPILAGVPFGGGLVLVFLSLMSYLIDCYTVYAASVLAANSVLRSLFGMAFPLFTSDMYRNLGVNWASAVPGFLALACLPFSFIFWKYGATIRKKSSMIAEADRILASMMRPRAAKSAPAPPKDVKEVV